jgi:transposase
MFVDYSGTKAHYVEPTTGEVVEVELFVAVLGASSYTYAEATRTQRVADFTASNARAFTFFGGVTNAVVPDQLKSAVTIANLYEPGVQRTFAELGRHYGTTILPARPRSPRVEVAVQVAQRWILARMPASHQKHAEWTPTRILGWASTVGPMTAKLAEAMLAERRHPEHGFRSCLGIFRLAKRYGHARVEAACARALVAGAPRGLRTM